MRAGDALVAQILDHLHGALSVEQRARAVALLQRNLAESGDWIVLDTTMDVLTRWARDAAPLAAWLVPHLERLAGDRRASVARRAGRRLADLRG
jgi:hypothetical protein